MKTIISIRTKEMIEAGRLLTFYSEIIPPLHSTFSHYTFNKDSLIEGTVTHIQYIYQVIDSREIVTVKIFLDGAEAFDET